MRQASPAATPYRDQVGHSSEPVLEAKLVGIRRGADLNAGPPNDALPSPLIRRSKPAPVEHVGVNGRQGLAREQQLIPRRIRRSMQIENALHQPIVVKIAAAVAVI